MKNHIDFSKAPPDATHYSVSDLFIGILGYWVKDEGDHILARRIEREDSGSWGRFGKNGIWACAKPIPPISLENK